MGSATISYAQCMTLIDASDTLCVNQISSNVLVLSFDAMPGAFEPINVHVDFTVTAL